MLSTFSPMNDNVQDTSLRALVSFGPSGWNESHKTCQAKQRSSKCQGMPQPYLMSDIVDVVH